MDYIGDLTTQLSSNGTSAACNGFYSPYDAYRAFDHSTASGDGGASAWFSATTAFPHWISYYFGGTAYKLGTVTIRYHPDYASARPITFNLQGSKDGGTNFDQLLTVESATYTNYEASYVLNTSAAYTHFRLWVTANAGASYVGVHEITITEYKVILSPQGKTGSWSTEAFPAQTKTWTGSGTYSGQTMIATTSCAPYSSDTMVEKAFDGNGGYSPNAFLGSGYWFLTIEFETTKTVASYKIHDGGYSNYYATAWTFYGSNNGTSWDTLDSRSGQPDKASGIEYTISSPNAYRYYKYSITASASNGGYCSLNELYLYGFTGWSHKINGISTPAYVNGVAGSAISKVMGV